jgi:GNAT superfamily N-acetyltransferase
MITLRLAGAGDIAGLLQLWADAEAEPTVTDDVQALSALLAFNPQSVLLAVHGDVIVGSLIIGWDGWRGTFYRLAVAPAHRRKGAARRLVAEGEAQLLRVGARRLSVIAVAGDPRAAPFWTAVGYVTQAGRQRLVKNVPAGT